MKYMRTELRETEKGLPRLIFSEIEDNGIELRKIEIYDDGMIGYAFDKIEVGKTALADQIIPTVEEINKDDDIIASYLEREEFEKIWNKYVSNIN